MSDNYSPGGFDRLRRGADGGTGMTQDVPAPAPAPEVQLSEAVTRFRSCRWRRPPEDNNGVECCGHRDVLPLAGSTSFDAEAWCPDCNFYKLRRTPKKRDPNDYRY